MYPFLIERWKKDELREEKKKSFKDEKYIVTSISALHPFSWE
jgi:hypothetical protein